MTAGGDTRHDLPQPWHSLRRIACRLILSALAIALGGAVAFVALHAAATEVRQAVDGFATSARRGAPVVQIDGPTSSRRGPFQPLAVSHPLPSLSQAR